MKHTFTTIIILLCAFLPVKAQFAGGSGTPEDPWQVATLEQLQAVGEQLEGHFVQTADIDASVTETMNEGLGFAPIGNDATPFTGTYDGKGYSIDNLHLNRAGQNYVGLFGSVGPAGVLNHVTLNQAQVTASDYAGILAGHLSGGKISNSSTSGSIAGPDRTGGLVGLSESGAEIFRSSSSATVTGPIDNSQRLGGLVGFSNASDVIESFATGPVTGQEILGGLVGLIRNGAKIADSYATGEVTGNTRRAGGLLGYIRDDPSSVTRSYAAGRVTAETLTGGLIGERANNGSITDSYWDLETSEQTQGSSNVSDGMTGLTTSQMTGAAALDNMTAFDFTDVWETTEGYPALQWKEIEDEDPPFAGGSGTPEDPWLVATAEQLDEVRNHRTAHFLQIADIDLADAGNFIPIGETRDENILGTYDGGGHVVSNLTIRLGGTNRGQALFGYLGDTGVIRNLGVIDVDVLGGSNSAALVGQQEGGLVQNCWSTGTVRSEAGGRVSTGGLVGILRDGARVENSYSSVDVITTGRRAGGLVGTNDGGIISNSYATGTVVAENTTDTSWSGGLVGENSGNAQVIRSWASVSVDAHLIGGLAGASTADVTLTQSYWDAEAMGITDAIASGDADVSGVTGLQTAQMQGQAAYSNMPGLDFELVWHLTEGYPALQWEDVDALPLPAEPGPARVQIIHNSADPAAAAVDIYVNGALLVDSLAFRAATPFVDVPFDTPLLIEIYPFGADPAQSDAAYSLEDAVFSADETYTVIANGLLGEGFADNPDALGTDFDLFVIAGTKELHGEVGEASFFIWHGATDAPGVDVFARDAAQLADDLKYTDYTDYVDVPAANYIIDITSAGFAEVLVSYAAPLNSLGGQSMAILASGFLNPEDNNNGEAFGLLAVLANGTAFMLEDVIDIEVPFPGGSGTENDPWHVANLEQLQAIGDFLDAHFILVSDIDASETETMNDGHGFAPIGSEENRFNGSLDGNGYKITNLVINRGPDEEITEYVGLFAVVDTSGVLMNLHLENLNVTGKDYTGGLVGFIHGGMVADILITGTIFGQDRTGGIIGLMENGSELIRSQSYASVTAQNRRVGGLVGFNNGSMVRESSSAGSVLAIDDDAAGGLVGLLRFGGIIENSYSSASVTSLYRRAGGLVGLMRDDPTVIKQSYATGEITSPEDPGGLVGLRQQNGQITDSYWDIETTRMLLPGSGSPAGLVGLTTDQMTGHNALINMPGLDFESVWVLTESYPALYWEDVDPLPIPVFVELHSPEDGATGVELIPTLRWFALEGVTSYQVQLAKDADFSNLHIDVTVSDTLMVPDSELDYETVYYWRVQAADGEEASVWSQAWTFTTRLATAADNELPTEFSLRQNYPNPFNPSTNIEFSLPVSSHVVLEVFTIQGQRVARLVNGNLEAGIHSVSFDASSLGSGVYLYRIQAGDFIRVNKMMLIK
jgi:hypothetical protein